MSNYDLLDVWSALHEKEGKDICITNTNLSFSFEIHGQLVKVETSYDALLKEVIKLEIVLSNISKIQINKSSIATIEFDDYVLRYRNLFTITLNNGQTIIIEYPLDNE